ncbi:Na+/H+ antiporter NhaC [Clostridiaceae bacterium 35-E11]
METKIKQVCFAKAMIPVIFLIVALVSTLKYFGGDPHIPILAAAAVAAMIAVASGQKWADLENGMIETIRDSMQAVLIVGIIGMIIGTWILSGTVPTMIYYGLKIISPKVFLVAACLICSMVALATGSSWTTAGTVGIALIGMGQGLGIPLPMVAGAIISGAYFGDKMSPLSDTTNLAPAMAGTTLFEHIRHMIYTTGPSYVISLILYGILGIKYGSKTLDTTSINSILNALSSQFVISPLLLIPPILVIVMVVLKAPAIPGLIGGTVLGGIFAFIFQGVGMSQIIEATHYGYVSETGNEVIDSLLTRGGLDSMMWTLSLVLIAMCFGGIMEKSGMLNAIASKIVLFANNTGNLILATVLTCIATVLVTGEQYLSMVIPGRMYKNIYADLGLHPKNLSRTLEDAGTLTSPLIPWSTCGAFMYTSLGVYPFVYAPFAFLCIINPLIAIFYGYTGITLEKLPQEVEV